MRRKYLYVVCYILTVFLSFVVNSMQAKPIITDYHRTFIPLYKEESLRIAIRMYYDNATPYFLLVDPYTFKTEILPAKKLHYRRTDHKSKKGAGYFSKRMLDKTPYIRALNRYSSSPYPLENDGIVQTEHSVRGSFLTIDMCPSMKPFEKDFFETLVERSQEKHKTIPIALSITGAWILGHRKEFGWILKQQKTGKLNITWINHSFSHIYYPDVPFRKNFLLTEQTNFEQEVLSTEKMLLEYGQIPSPFFRFPGLVSNKDLILKLKKLGLITIGSNAWLAKEEKVKNGSFILVHGNGNEPKGIEKIMLILKDPMIQFLPLQEAFQK